MNFEILELGLQWDEDRKYLKQLEVPVRFGPNRATLFLWPEEPLTSQSEAASFARRKVRELAEAVLSKRGSPSA